MADTPNTYGIDPGAQKLLSEMNATPPEQLPIADTSPPTPEPQSEGASVNVFNPEGKLVSISTHQLNDAINEGYRPASSEEVEHHAQQEKYGSLGQQLITGVEGAAEAASFGTSPALEEAFGVPAEDIRARKEENPGFHMLGQVGGLGLSALIPGVGEANVLRTAGEAGAAALGLGAAEGTLAKIGSSAVKAAIENMVFQGTTEEVSKLITKDPNQTAETAITDIGLSALLGAGAGGVFGAVSPLWTATMGKKTGGVLKAIADRVGGVEGVTSDAVNQAIDTLGIDVKPEVRAAMAEDPHIQALAKTLEQSDTTKSGLGYQEALKDFRSKANDALVSALGKTPQEIEAGAVGRSAYEAGTDIKDSLIKSLKEQIDPIANDFEAVKSKFKDLPLNDKGALADRIVQVATENGWTKAPSSDEMQVVNRVLKELPLQETLEDLRRFQSNIGEETHRKQLWRVGGQLKTVFREAEDNLVTKALGDQAPELLEKHALTRGAYKDAMTTIDQLNDRLHVGRYGGPESFYKALREMSPEDIVRRTAGKNDVEMLDLLQNRFPAVADQVRAYHLGNLLENAARRAQPGELISPKVLTTALDKLSPELQRFILPDGAAPKLQAISVLKDQLERVPHNFSNTARTVDKLLNNIPGSAVAMATMAAGHNPAMAVILGGLTKYLGRDVPDATRLALLKFLGSNKQIDAAGFKSMFDYTAATMRGENTLSRGVKNLFNAGSKVLPESFMPSQKNREKLDKHLKDLQVDASPLLETGGKIGHYLPEHGQAMAETSARVTNYLNTLRPTADKRFPLDSKQKPDPIKQTQYNRALDIAEQPLVVLDAISKGTVTSQDVIAMRSMYPALYSRTVQKLTSQIIEQSNKGEAVPYKTRMGVSIFMGQPLDSTMTPQAILSAQPTPPQSQPQTATQPASNPKRSTSSLNKLPGMYQTSNQARDTRANKQ